MIELRQLTLQDEAAFHKGLELFAGEEAHWYSFIWSDIKDYKKMLTALEKEHLGIELAPGRVAHTMYYAFLDGQIVGRLSLRHTLNKYLLERGGHIGYAVAPKFRRMGLAKSMLEQGLKKCLEFNINPVLITCDEDNTASVKIIEHFGGQLENVVVDPENGEKVRRYWVKF